METTTQLPQSLPADDMSFAVAVGVPDGQVKAAESDGKRWFIAIVAHNTEKSCCRKLEELFTIEGKKTLDFETYVPSQKELRIWRNGRRKKVDRILIPTFLFIRCTEDTRKAIKIHAVFIKHFMKDPAGQTDAFGMYPFAFIPEHQMLNLQRMVGDAETPVTIDPRRLYVGVRVRVKGGRLKGLEGNILREPSGSTSLVLGIHILGYAKVEMPLELLEVMEN
ncbi:MAG: transcription termination/antitermination NusG family protein [Bacteroidales bacterium]|nr:transcription termination/antitermination NusG family protein [Bacteroidales bacterium]